MRVTGLLRSGRLAVAVLALSACSVFEAPKPTEHTAVIKPGRWGEVYRGGAVSAVAVNGVDPGWRLRADLQVAPGDLSARIDVFLCTGGATPCNNVIAASEVRFRAEAGRVYRPHARERVNGSNRFWIWVEDDATGEAVGGDVSRSQP